MSPSFHPRRDILPTPQKALWSQLAPTVRLGFVLYGGTAIALRLGHRASVDFDFFTDQPLEHRELHAAMPFLDSSTTLQESADTPTVVATASARKMQSAEYALTARELLAGIPEAVVVEEYSNYPKGPCVLLLQKDRAGKPVHAVWGILRGQDKPAVLVTAFRPDPAPSCLVAAIGATHAQPPVSELSRRQSSR